MEHGYAWGNYSRHFSEPFCGVFSNRVDFHISDNKSHGNDEINDPNELQNLAAQQAAYPSVEKRPKIKFSTESE